MRREAPFHGSLVCSVDDSDNARAAARVAARLSEKLRLKVVLVHVSQVPTLVGSRALGSREPSDASVSPDDDKRAQSLLATVAVEEELGPVESRVEFGLPAEQLVRVSREEEAELIVLGSRGQGSLKAVLLGSVSMGVIARARCPILVVPPGAAAPA
jgi:nucleotide-binding universal stress UspA family protein